MFCCRLYKYFFFLGSAVNGTCPIMCPTVCHPGHISCSGGFDPNGCPRPDTCVKIEDGCPAVCPIECPPNHMSCDGGYDRNGCKMPATCVANSGM